MTADWLVQSLGTKDDLSIGQECLRALIVFAYGMVLVRVTGRRVLGEWGSFDIIVAMILGSTLSRVVVASAPVVGTLAAMTLLVGLHWMFGRACARWPSVSRLIEGVPITLVHQGRVLTENLRAQGISMSDLQGAMRKESVEDASETRRVTLEPNGDITIVKLES